MKCGNSLVGCWFDRFQDYPALAWEREGGDKSHKTGAHFREGTWTKAIKDFRAKEVKNSLRSWLSNPKQLRFEAMFAGKSADAVHDEAPGSSRSCTHFRFTTPRGARVLLRADREHSSPSSI